MGVFKDLTGLRFGLLTVIKQAPFKYSASGKTKTTQWYCKCDCGNETIVNSSNLIRGHTRSCGCLAFKENRDLIGRRFGKLTVEEFVGHKKKGREEETYWLCHCDCGHYTTVTTRNLCSGHTKSCGCLKLESMPPAWDKLHQYNEYKCCGDYYIGYTHNTGKEFYFDADDYDRVSQYCWNENSHGYITTQVWNGFKQSRKVFALHVFIMHRENADQSDGIRVDHIKTENKNDCRKSNLRLVMWYQNAMNRQRNKNNTSGYTGVRQNKNGTWTASIGYQKKQITIGTYKTKQEAIDARIRKEDELFGEYGYHNSQEFAGNNAIELGEK